MPLAIFFLPGAGLFHGPLDPISRLTEFSEFGKTAHLHAALRFRHAGAPAQ
jgi:hypothetical protein